MAERGQREVVGQSKETASTALQRMLDSLKFSPAFVETAAWNIVAWNYAAAVTLTDYGALAPEKRNLLRLLFSGPASKAAIADWEKHARSAVNSFRLEIGRVGASGTAKVIVDELSDTSRDFAAMWLENAVGSHGQGVKVLRHPDAGLLTFGYGTFAVDGQPTLGLLVFTPATPEDGERVRVPVRQAEK